MEEAKKKLTKKDLISMFIRSNFHQGSWNFERMQALGFCFEMVPIIRRLYSGEERKQAIKRHLEFFNTHPYVTAPILGVTAAMEEEKANGAPIEDSTINGLKVGLMGPLAGVGDPIFWGTIRPVFAALGATIAMTGNILGPILFFVLFNAVRLAVRWYGIMYGYKQGANIIADMRGNRLQKLTEGAAILGLFVMGALVSKWTTINVPVVVSKVVTNGKTVTTTVQDILDQLLPGLLPLLLTFATMSLLKKKVNAIWIIFGFFAIGILGYALGILK
ncbi:MULTISPECIES: PTS mannose transporter subunit IID [Thermoanaerobacterium]|jgi:PTS system mannose-specific IID component|uniref:PTS system, mannose/fructose/sorbose family, IID subunit n=1 Tax=Thermoanaerobacterium thermosaccharolyticum (strain ATCC 7956 / DSM 571 / NCIMB 9385 / NCA 3814 / NCTC 13789 / WDCM 00135 / 2032) TaxID=580327 RepID=D9TRF2_THETC|nr:MULTISPECIES: PTS mannose transporter subunit IID [Thermoanaerobacterium]TCW31585.1 PTS system D-mannose-specific IID component (Man family) [Thermohydrogenium kirishiense]ADL69322.1 PTS system, mannose/fructose/sorbose family, IID subunit [Thermoanaerobacterium thermosaccharolyticum DSM 571]KAA5805790.1 PTS mannose transporter subunit IID [Thermoanaerobacterium thermosaccharolyticum]MCP2240838.1 PTS system mannose-specific IID component [Thermoanaerobacterium thermosaccharolyticum]WKV09491